MTGRPPLHHVGFARQRGDGNRHEPKLRYAVKPVRHGVPTDPADLGSALAPALGGVLFVGGPR